METNELVIRSTLYCIAKKIYFRKPSDELVLQWKSLVYELKLAGESFDTAYKSFREAHGAKALTEEEAHKIWAREYGRFGHVISNLYGPGPDNCMTDAVYWLRTATRVIDGRYIYCRDRPEKSIILIDLFYENMKT